MRKCFLLTPVLLVITIVFVLPVVGEQYDAHEHGAVEMQIIIENSTVECVLIVPGADVIGFEHEPMNDEEAAIEKERLSDIEKKSSGLIAFNKKSKAVLQSFTISGNDFDHEEEGREEHEDHDEHEEEHAEFTLHFIYSVKKIGKLKEIDLTGFFKQFFTVAKLHWILISDDGQSAGEAGKNNHTIMIK